MKLNELVGQLTMIGVSGHALTNDEKKFIVQNNISGVVLFSRNISTPEQVRELCEEIQSLTPQMKDKAPLFIGIDMEGGRVHRLKSPFTQWPPLKTVGDLDHAPTAFLMSYFMGLELKSVGINLDFAPCIDIFTNPLNTVIGDRAVSTDYRMVEKMASALVRGYIKAGVLSCAKHFPGHGHTLIDSHEELPVEEADLKRLEDIELAPFKKAFKSKVDFVMTGHILFKNVDPQWPVTLSEFFLKKVLRGDMKYRGLILTDDLDMKAMAKHYDKGEIPVRALEAGADMLLYCNEPDSPPVAIESVMEAIVQNRLDKEDIELIHKKILAVKKEKLMNFNMPSWKEAQNLIGSENHKYIADCLRAKEIPSNEILAKWSED